MIAVAHVNAEILELRAEDRVDMDRIGLRSIYCDLVTEAAAAYVLKRSLFSTQLLPVDVHTLNSHGNFRIAMSGERMVIAISPASLASSSLRRHYCPESSNGIPPRMGELARITSELLAREANEPVSAYLFLHDLEAVLLMHPG